MRIAHTILLSTLLAGCLLTSPTRAAHRCPFCSAPSLTLAEQLAQSDAAALVMWVEAKKAREVDGKRLPSSTLYEVREVIRDARGSVKQGNRVTLS